MKRKIFLLFIVLLSSVALYAQIPGTITYQGYLTDAAGKPKSGTHKLAFNFYDGASIVATRTISSVNVVNGLFTEIIGKDAAGENASLPLTVWGKPITVGIAVDAEAELPKISLTSMPYAFTAQVANSVSGTLIASNIPTLDASKITGTFIASNIPNLDASKITTGTITNALLDADLQDLADGSLSGSKVGTGVSATNITTGVLTGSLVGTGVNASNITTGTLSGSLVGSGISATNVTGTLPLTTLGHLTDGTLTGLEVSGFTQLGTAAPLLQMKKLTGTLSGAVSGTVTVNHGLTASKILSVSILVEYSTGNFVPADFMSSNGYLFNWYITPSQIVVANVDNTSGSSTTVRGKNFTILITYEQ